MKRIPIWLALLVLIGYSNTGGSIGTPDVKTTTWINVPFEAVDTTTGVGRIPDSVSVITFFGNCTNAGIFQVSSASLDSNWWDSTQTGAGVAGSKIYFFKEVVADLDADSGAGLYTGVINAWFQGYPMPTYFSFNLVDTTGQEWASLNYFSLIAYRDSVENAITATNKANFKYSSGDTLFNLYTIVNTILDDSLGNAKNKIILVYNIVEALLDDSLGNAKNNILAYLDEAISGLDDNPWDDGTRTLTAGNYTNEIDSLLAALYDRTNDTTFIRILSQYVLKHLHADSVTIDNSNAWDLSGGTDLSVKVDSILATLYDRTNDTAFMQIICQYVLKHLYPDSVTIDNSNAWDLVGAGGTDLSDEVDSLLAAIYDRANDTSFVRIISQYVLKHLHADSVTIDNSNAWDLSGGTDLSDEVDSLLAAIYDRANDSSFVRILVKEFLAHRDSVLSAMADANKPNFMADVSNLDEPISGLDDNPWNNALTDTASGMGNWFADYFNAIFGPKFDSLVQSIADANKANFKADVSGLSTHSAADVWTAGSRSLSTPADYKATGFAVAGDPMTFQSDSLYTLLNNLIAFKDSVENAVTDANKANFKGGAGDTAAIGRSVWDNDIVTQANRTVTASCAGSGARTVVIWIKDITDSTGIAGFEIDIEDSVGGGGVYGNTTNSSGCFTLSLDDATWTIHLQKVPYSITSPVYETISGNTTLTYYATPFTPGSPPADSLCVVWGRVKDKHGNAYVGAKVSIWMDAYPVTFGGILIDVATKSVVYTDTLGIFEFSDGIYYCSSLNPSNLKWKIRVKTTNWIWEGPVTVPSQASWEIEIP